MIKNGFYEKLCLALDAIKQLDTQRYIDRYNKICFNSYAIGLELNMPIKIYRVVAGHKDIEYVKNM